MLGSVQPREVEQIRLGILWLAEVERLADAGEHECASLRLYLSKGVDSDITVSVGVTMESPVSVGVTTESSRATPQAIPEHALSFPSISTAVTAVSCQCFWRSVDTALRRARAFWVNRSISGDLLAGLPSSPRTSRTDSR
jgi:hypothetical protein